MTDLTLTPEDFETIRTALASARGWIQADAEADARAGGDGEWASKYAAMCGEALHLLHRRFAESIGVVA